MHFFISIRLSLWLQFKEVRSVFLQKMRTGLSLLYSRVEIPQGWCDNWRWDTVSCSSQKFSITRACFTTDWVCRSGGEIDWLLFSQGCMVRAARTGACKWRWDPFGCSSQKLSVGWGSLHRGVGRYFGK